MERHWSKRGVVDGFRWLAACAKVWDRFNQNAIGENIMVMGRGFHDDRGRASDLGCRHTLLYCAQYGRPFVSLALWDTKRTGPIMM